jgi:hypothetical protein
LADHKKSYRFCKHHRVLDLRGDIKENTLKKVTYF